MADTTINLVTWMFEYEDDQENVASMYGWIKEEAYRSVSYLLNDQETQCEANIVNFHGDIRTEKDVNRFCTENKQIDLLFLDFWGRWENVDSYYIDRLVNLFRNNCGNPIILSNPDLNVQANAFLFENTDGTYGNSVDNYIYFRNALNKKNIDTFKNQGKEVVLIIDDDIHNLRFALQQLGKKAVVITETDFSRGFKLIGHIQPDVLLCDLNFKRPGNRDQVETPLGPVLVLEGINRGIKKICLLTSENHGHQQIASYLSNIKIPGVRFFKGLECMIETKLGRFKNWLVAFD